MRVRILSNVPGTPDLSVLSIPLANDKTEAAIDLSLENAMSFHEATVELALDAMATCSAIHDWNPPPWGANTYYEGTGSVEVRDFRIVGKRRAEQG